MGQFSVEKPVLPGSALSGNQHPAGFGVRFRASATTYSAWLARLSVKPITSSSTFTLPTPGPTLVTIPAKSEPSPEGNVAGHRA
jgi:hypothetical protein